jgi:hypothetical protein
LELDQVTEWQSACMLTRDAWIELTQELCKSKQIDTSDIDKDKVVERLEKLRLNKTDEKIYFIAKDSFNLSLKHHKRDINRQEDIACVVSSVVSMQLVIQKILNSEL